MKKCRYCSLFEEKTLREDIRMRHGRQDLCPAASCIMLQKLTPHKGQSQVGRQRLGQMPVGSGAFGERSDGGKRDGGKGWSYHSSSQRLRFGLRPLWSLLYPFTSNPPVPSPICDTTQRQVFVYSLLILVDDASSSRFSELTLSFHLQYTFPLSVSPHTVPGCHTS